MPAFTIARPRGIKVAAGTQEFAIDPIIVPPLAYDDLANGMETLTGTVPKRLLNGHSDVAIPLDRVIRGLTIPVEVRFSSRGRRDETIESRNDEPGSTAHGSGPPASRFGLFPNVDWCITPHI
jgi:hypothetical protein